MSRVEPKEKESDTLREVALKAAQIAQWFDEERLIRPAQRRGVNLDFLQEIYRDAIADIATTPRWTAYNISHHKEEVESEVEQKVNNKFLQLRADVAPGSSPAR